METLLKSQESTDQTQDKTRQDSTSAYVASTLQQGLPTTADKTPNPYTENISPCPDFQTSASANAQTAEGEFPWEMIGLGLDEPLPPQDVMDDL